MMLRDTLAHHQELPQTPRQKQVDDDPTETDELQDDPWRSEPVLRKIERGLEKIAQRSEEESAERRGDS